MSQSGVARVAASVLPPSVPLQFTGDNGTFAVPAGNNITIFSSTVSQNSGSTVSFFNSGSTSQLNFSDALSNTLLGSGAGNSILTGSNNSSIGSGTLRVLTSGQFNAAIGFESLFALTTGSFNTALGYESLFGLKTGNHNIAIGDSSGSIYSGAETENICIGNTGTLGESGVIRIGTQGAPFQSSCFIAGITGVTVPNSQLVTINNSTQQMGVIGNGTTGQVLIATTGASPTFGNISTTGAVISLTGNSGGAILPVAGNINTLGTGSITIAGAGSTLTTQLTGLTNHAVLVGAGTATITKVGPTSTAGQVLQSAGASADPAFSTATYPLTTTINQILYSSAANTISEITAANNGTLITGATGVPSLLANGTTGQVLIATTGSPPSWGAAPSSFAPNTTIQLVDDFIGLQRFASSISSNYYWFVTLSGGATTWTTTSTINDSGHPGVIGCTAFTTSCDLFLNCPAVAVVPEIILGGGAIILNWIVKVATLSVANPRYTLRIGFGDTAAADQVNGVYFEYTDNVNSGQWQYKTANASTRTTNNSTIAANTSYHNFQISINAAGTSCAFTIDGVSLGAAITTNIPTLAITPCIEILAAVGTVATNSVLVDLMYFSQTLTTPR